MGARRLGSSSTFLSLASAAFMLGVWPSHAVEPGQKVVRVGFVDPESPAAGRPSGVDGFWQRLRELGWVEGKNLVIEERQAEGRYERLPALMSKIVASKVDVIVTYGTPPAIAARNATSTVPIVDALMGDPVGTGLAASLARPGSNLTGLSFAWSDIASKWLELLHETVPHLSTVAVIANPDTPLVGLAKEIRVVAPTHALKTRTIEVRNPQALDRAFRQAERGAQGVVVMPDPMLSAHRQQVTVLAAKRRLPAIYPIREFVDAGGLMAYGPSTASMFRRAAEYVDKILKGAKPRDLPIEQPTKFELVVNLRTAKALGLAIPESILLRADEVIK